MKLEEFFKPVRIVDDAFHRIYSKSARKWEDDGGSRYSLSATYDAINFIGNTLMPVGSPRSTVYALIGGISCAQSIIGLTTGEHNKGLRQVGGNFMISSPIFYFSEKLGKIIRTPELIAGLCVFVNGLADIYNGLQNKDNSNLVSGLRNVSEGIGLFSNASAWFIRDSDPAILDKKPLWKEAFEGLGDTIRKYITAPVSQPIPVKH